VSGVELRLTDRANDVSCASSYVSLLLARLRSLERYEAQQAGRGTPPSSDDEMSVDTGDTAQTAVAKSAVISGHFPADAGLNVRYLGASSPFFFASQIVSHTLPLGALTSLHPPSTDSASTSFFQFDPSLLYSDPPFHSPQLITSLVQAYLSSYHFSLPLLPSSTIDAALAAVLAPTRSVVPTPIQYFTVFIICAQSAELLHSHPTPFQRSHLRDGYAHLASRYMPIVMAGINNDTLQAAMLLLAFYFYDPTKGSISSLVGFAARLCVELGLTSDTGSKCNGGTFSQAAREKNSSDETTRWRRRAYWSVYNLEAELAIGLGRPTFLPEPWVG
jgi:hypothetical protein